MAKFDSKLNDLITKEITPMWDALLKENPDAVVDKKTINLGLEDLTFDDFVEEIKLALT